MKIGDKVRVKDCDQTYHPGEENTEAVIIAIDFSRTFPIKLSTGNHYLAECLEVID